jgi:hypothetical protein
MKRWLICTMIWWLRRRGGEVNVLAPTYRTERRLKRRYHVVLLQEHHYVALRMNTTWSRGDSL